MWGKGWQCTHKVVHTQGGLWPPQESCYLRGVWGLPPRRAKRAEVHNVWGKGWQCTHKAVCGHRRGLVI